jgi:hypothetical protein
MLVNFIRAFVLIRIDVGKAGWFMFLQKRKVMRSCT